MHQATRDRLHFGALALLAVLVAAPGIHVFELWFEHPVALWLSHGLAAVGLVATGRAWRRAARARAEGTPGRSAV